MKDMSARDPENTKTVIIVGGGPSGATCAESLRQEGFTGRIIMICRENVIPYDRVKVSKKLNFDVHSATLRSPSFYKKHNIETKLRVKAIGIYESQTPISIYNCNIYMYKCYFVFCTTFFLFCYRFRYD